MEGQDCIKGSHVSPINREAPQHNSSPIHNREYHSISFHSFGNTTIHKSSRLHSLILRAFKASRRRKQRLHHHHLHHRRSTFITTLEYTFGLLVQGFKGWLQVLHPFIWCISTKPLIIFMIPLCCLNDSMYQLT